ncbi:hypothetical protein ACS0TY_034638 [Phlomoides rotata]
MHTLIPHTTAPPPSVDPRHAHPHFHRHRRSQAPPLVRAYCSVVVVVLSQAPATSSSSIPVVRSKSSALFLDVVFCTQCFIFRVLFKLLICVLREVASLDSMGPVLVHVITKDRVVAYEPKVEILEEHQKGKSLLILSSTWIWKLEPPKRQEKTESSE